MNTKSYKRRHQRGMTLIEILIATGIAMFLLGGLFTIVGNTRRVYAAQNQMAALLDDERMAMTMISDVIQNSGYFPNPTVYTAAGLFPVTGAFTVAGQSIVGTDTGSAPPGDTITLRYETASGDGMINCTGGTNTSGANALYTNKFLIDANGNLACSLNGAASVPLVSGLTNLQLMYGVKTDFSLNNGAVDSYLAGSEMTTANWNNVICIRVTLTFTNPVYTANPSLVGVPPTISFTRVVGVMRDTGVTS